VLGWKFFPQVGNEKRCEILIPARNRHTGWLQEKLSVSVVQEGDEEENTKQYLEAELEFRTVNGTSKHRITMKDDTPIKHRYYLKNRKVQGEFNAKLEKLLKIGFIEHSELLKLAQSDGEEKDPEIGKGPRIIYILNQLRKARPISSMNLSTCVLENSFKRN